MQKVILSAILSCVVFILPCFANALQESRPLPLDTRLHVITYNPNGVHRYVGFYNYQSSILFGENEKIETLSMGNPTAWQVSPVGNRLFIKPISAKPEEATTNMLIITNVHIYHFVLEAKEVGEDGINEEGLVFETRFLYPEQDADTLNLNNSSKGPDLTTPEKYNFNYNISGSYNISPLRIFDDAEFTYFQFAKQNSELPTFFIVDSEGKEALVNYRIMGDYVVIERVTSQFTLRNGADVVCVFNETMPLQRARKQKK